MNHSLTFGYEQQSQGAHCKGTLIFNEGLCTHESHTLRYINVQVWEVVNHEKSLYFMYTLHLAKWDEWLNQAFEMGFLLIQEGIEFLNHITLVEITFQMLLRASNIIYQKKRGYMRVDFVQDICKSLCAFATKNQIVFFMDNHCKPINFKHVEPIF